jgi:signal transduction histidine kinase
MLEVKETADKIMPGNAVEINFDQLPDDQQKLVINGNETLLKAAFSNIVLNSCKYSDNKPVKITIRAEDNDAVIDITDKGIGIPDREMSQIFVPFFRASNTEKYKGYGIGLPLANNIIKMHRGTIIVNSEVGIGTRFTIHLPSEI